MKLAQTSRSTEFPSREQMTRWETYPSDKMITPQQFVELNNFIVTKFKDPASLNISPALQMPGLVGVLAEVLESIPEFRSTFGPKESAQEDIIDRRINADVEEMKPFAASLLYVLVQGARGAFSNPKYASLKGYDAMDEAMKGFPFVEMIQFIQKYFTDDNYKTVFAKDEKDSGLWFKKIVDNIVYRYSFSTLNPSFVGGYDTYKHALASNALKANSIPYYGTQVVQTLAEKFVLPNNAEKYNVSPDEFHALARLIRGDKKSLSSKLGTVLASKQVFVHRYADDLRKWRYRGAPVRRSSMKTWPEMEALFDSPEYAGDITKEEFIQRYEIQADDLRKWRDRGAPVKRSMKTWPEMEDFFDSSKYAANIKKDDFIEKYGTDAANRDETTPYVYSPEPHNNLLFEYLSNVVLYGLAQGSIGVNYAQAHRLPISYTGYDYIHQAVQKVIPLGEILGLIVASFDDGDYKTVFGDHADNIKTIFNKLAALKIGRASGPIDPEDLHYMITHNYANMPKNEA